MATLAEQNIYRGVPTPTRENIEDLEEALLQLPQVTMPIKSEFLNGLYIRTMYIPATTLLTGAVHKEDHVFFVREGRLIVWTDGYKHEFKPGDMIFSKAGIKKVGYAVDHCVVSTVHPNPENISEEEELWRRYTTSDMPLAIKEKMQEVLP